MLEAQLVEIPKLIETDPGQRSLGARVALASGAVVVLILGVIGWILPIVPGLPLIVVGLGMLGLCSRRAASWINATEARLPRRIRLALRPRMEAKPADGSGDLLTRLLAERGMNLTPPGAEGGRNDQRAVDPTTARRDP
jgi:hypothetical protein